MAQGDNPVVQQLEEQMERIQERLRRPQRSSGGWLKLLGGLGLGAVVGGALAFYLRSRQEEPLYAPPPPPPPAPPRRDDAVLLRPAPTPPSAPVAKDDDAPITLKTSSAPTALAEESAAEPVAEATEAPAAEEPITEAAPLVASDSAPPAEAATEATAGAETPAALAEAEPAAAATEESGAATDAPTASGDVEELTYEEAMDAPVAEFYANAIVPTEGQCPTSHPIKGNINRNGMLIFHTPDSNNYDRTKAEACFATAEDAEAVGFRKSRS